MLQALIPQWNQHSNVNGDYVEVWGVPSFANQMPCTHQRQNKVLSTSVSFLIFWKFIRATGEVQVFEAWYRLYFGNDANNALNIYGIDAYFKMCMNHCVKSIHCKNRMVHALAADRHPSPNIWSAAAITLTGDWGRSHLLTIKASALWNLHKALDFGNLWQKIRSSGGRL